MTIQTLSPQDTQSKIEQGARLIDIRETMEYKRENIPNAISVPLSQLETSLANHITSQSTVIFHCKSGMRTKFAKAKISELAKQHQVECFILEGGLDAWKKAGLPTHIDRRQPIELMRQVQIAAGSLVLLGTILGSSVSAYFYLLSAFVGAGLIFAGVTGICGMARLLAKMPWNKSI